MSLHICFKYFLFADKIIRLAATLRQKQTWFWDGYSNAKSKTPPNLSTCLIGMNLLVPVFPPVHRAFCTRHQYTTQMGKDNFKVRKIPNCQSSACAGHCAATKIGPLCLRWDVLLIWLGTFSLTHYPATLPLHLSVYTFSCIISNWPADIKQH